MAPRRRPGAGDNPTLRVQVGDTWYTVEAVDLASDPARVRVDGELVEVTLGQPTAAHAAEPEPETRSEPEAEVASPAAPAGGRTFRTPMPGVIVSVAVAAGDQVVTGDEVCVLEAMKMQQTLRADWTGIVKTVYVQPGQQVADGAPIVDLE